MATVAVHILCILFLGNPHGGMNVQCSLTIEYSEALAANLQVQIMVFWMNIRSIFD